MTRSAVHAVRFASSAPPPIRKRFALCHIPLLPLRTDGPSNTAVITVFSASNYPNQTGDNEAAVVVFGRAGTEPEVIHYRADYVVKERDGFEVGKENRQTLVEMIIHHKHPLAAAFAEVALDDSQASPHPFCQTPAPGVSAAFRSVGPRTGAPMPSVPRNRRGHSASDALSAGATAVDPVRAWHMGG